MSDQMVSQIREKTYGRSAAPLIEELEARGTRIVSARQLAAIKGLEPDSAAMRSLVRRLTASHWLVPLARRGMYEFVPVRVGVHSSNDALVELQALAQAPNAPRFQVALGTAAFLRGYADTAPSLAYVLFDKNATVRPPRLRERFKVIRTNENRLFGAEPLDSAKGVPVSTASRLFIEVALYWRHAGDLRSRDHWLAGAIRDVDVDLVATWAETLGTGTVARVGYLADRFGAELLRGKLAGGIKRRTEVSFGPPRHGVYDARWHVYDAIGIGRGE